METMVYEVNPEILVKDLKLMIELEISIPIDQQKLFIKMFGKRELMEDECSLSFYNIENGSKIICQALHGTDAKNDNANPNKNKNLNNQQIGKNKLFR